MQRRRFIQIMASSFAGASLGRTTTAAPALGAVQWNGYTLGAEGRFTLFTEDRAAAQVVLKHCFREIQRLENIFSLYDHTSELSQLNREGALAKPSADWRSILDAVTNAHATTQGLFDPTIQPLWKAYDNHFSKQSEPPINFEPQHETVGWGFVNYSESQVHFERPNMQLTLNGIAQGFITDRVTAIIKDAGYAHVLVELGETRAIGQHPDNRAWNVGIKDATNTTQLHEVVELTDQALATSGSYGSTFSEDGKYHHLIHPKLGLSSTHWKSLSVIAPTATEADALSTGLSFANKSQITALTESRADLLVFLQA
ncbi:MAG: FAD:protein FMN transferase [Lentimonas sp.]